MCELCISASVSSYIQGHLSTAEPSLSAVRVHGTPAWVRLYVHDTIEQSASGNSSTGTEESAKFINGHQRTDTYEGRMGRASETGEHCTLEAVRSLVHEVSSVSRGRMLAMKRPGTLI